MHVHSVSSPSFNHILFYIRFQFFPIIWRFSILMQCSLYLFWLEHLRKNANQVPLSSSYIAAAVLLVCINFESHRYLIFNLLPWIFVLISFAQLFAFVPLMYMCICTYYSLFKVGMLMFYSLTPRQTSSVNLLMICS